MTNDQFLKSGLTERKRLKYNQAMKNTLPKGSVNLDSIIEKKQIIDQLIKDSAFLASIEETEGPLLRIWADWRKKKIFLEFMNGDFKSVSIDLVTERLKMCDYLKDFAIN